MCRGCASLPALKFVAALRRNLTSAHLYHTVLIVPYTQKALGYLVPAFSYSLKKDNTTLSITDRQQSSGLGAI